MRGSDEEPAEEVEEVSEEIDDNLNDIDDIIEEVMDTIADDPAEERLGSAGSAVSTLSGNSTASEGDEIIEEQLSGTPPES